VKREEAQSPGGRFITVGVMEGTTLGAVRMYPDPSESPLDLKSLHAGDMLARIREMIVEVSQGQKVEWVGAGFPAIVRNGVIEESPNLGQLKGCHVTHQLEGELKAEGMNVPVVALNDADAIAAGNVKATKPGLSLVCVAIAQVRRE
jgi:predicted NBD/HSP70 family sugar kinase